MKEAVDRHVFVQRVVRRARDTASNMLDPTETVASVKLKLTIYTVLYAMSKLLYISEKKHEVSTST